MVKKPRPSFQGEKINMAPAAAAPGLSFVLGAWKSGRVIPRGDYFHPGGGWYSAAPNRG